MQPGMNMGELRGGNVGAVNPVNNEIIIQRCENGFIVRGGCKLFVFESLESSMKAIALYWSNPQEAEKIYCLR